MPTISTRLAGDVRSAIVASVVTFVGSILWDFLTPEGQKFYFVGSTGIGSPSLLFDLVNDEGRILMTFDPPEIQTTMVCEYSLNRGDTYADIALTYLERYQDCFVAVPQGERKLQVRPNLHSGALLLNEADKQYWCNCPASASASGTSGPPQAPARSQSE